MNTVFHPAHPHFSVHKAYIEGCFADPDNPPVVQVKPMGIWIDDPYPNWWEKDCVYRIKPRTITRTVTYPEPMREAPAMGTAVWLVMGEQRQPYKTAWTDADFLVIALKNGMCFASEADAQACYDALFGSEK